MSQSPSPPPSPTRADHEHGFTNGIVRTFLHSNLPIILILLATAVGAAALAVTPREEDPQIVVPMVDVQVSFPGRSAEEVERLIATPLEKIMHEIDGVEYVYSMSRTDGALVTIRFYVGEDRERSLVKVFKKIDENLHLVPSPEVRWAVKPVEIDDVPIVNMTLTSRTADAYVLRRTAEEVVARLAAVKNISRAYVVGGLPRTVHVYLDPERMRAYSTGWEDIRNALAAANVTLTSGDFKRDNAVQSVQAGVAYDRPEQLRDLVVGVHGGRPVFLKDVADVADGPAEITSFVRHNWGPARRAEERPGVTGALVGAGEAAGPKDGESLPAVTIAVAKKKGINAVSVSREILAEADRLKREVVPDNIEMVVTRNSGLASNDKVNDLVEALAVALILAVAVLTIGLGWREAGVVALAVPVVFGLTLAINLLAGLTINRVTLFALILSLGLLVDDPIVDVENIARHFFLRRKATPAIVMEAVSEIRPPLITATLAVIASFLPLFFITGMMGPYMRPMALNVPVTMFISMAVAFTVTPWLAYHVLRRKWRDGARIAGVSPASTAAVPAAEGDPHDLGNVQKSLLYRIFRPLMSPLLRRRWAGWLFLGAIGVLFLLAASLAATRHVPLKMLPYGNKDEFQLVLDFDRGTTLESADAAAREMEARLRTVPEVVDFTTYVGLAAPMDFNGMVRHYYLRRGDNVADIQVNLVDRKRRAAQTHAVALRIRDDLTAIARRHGARLKIVESPPGPPVLQTLVAEVYGRPGMTYGQVLDAARTVRARLAAEPGVVDVDDYIEANQVRWTFVTDKEKAALSGVTTDQVNQALQMALSGTQVGLVQAPGERNPLGVEARLPVAARSGTAGLLGLHVKGAGGELVPLAELGRWEERQADQTIYHKDLQRVMYVQADVVGRGPAEAVVDVMADRLRGAVRMPSEPGVWKYRRVGAELAPPADDPLTDPDVAKEDLGQMTAAGSGVVSADSPRPLEARSFLSPGGGIPWALPDGIRVDFAGEGEWKITLDVFRDMGLAFIAALAAIYILLVAQTRSFVIPVVVMLSIPLTILGIMPGFWLLNRLSAGMVGPYADPVFFTATGMIGMIALAGIVTRSAIILVDFVHISLRRGRSLHDAVIESCAVRLRPILLTASCAMLAALPIATDPVFSGLAWALVFGLLASTLFTLFVIPVVYCLLYARVPGHGAGEA